MEEPYRNLFSAVITYAIQDACLDPVQGLDKRVLVRDEARSAVEFIWGKHCDGYCEAIDLNPDQMRRRLEKLSEDRSESTASLTPKQRRALYFNIKECRRLSNIA